MKTLTLQIETRVRGKALALRMVRLANALRSVRIARFGVSLIHAEYRVTGAKKWTSIPLNIEVKKT